MAAPSNRPASGRAGTGTATFDFNGGTLKAAASSGTFMQGLSNTYVKSGSTWIDTQAHDVSIAQPLVHDPALGATADGGLTKFGVGTLTLNSANTYTGATRVDAGTLVCSQGFKNGAALIVVNRAKAVVFEASPRRLRPRLPIPKRQQRHHKQNLLAHDHRHRPTRPRQQRPRHRLHGASPWTPFTTSSPRASTAAAGTDPAS